VNTRTPKAPAKRTRKTALLKDPERTRADILVAATREFAENGYSGARIEHIVERMRTSKRMIYYYFGDKRGLYSAVLEAYYRSLREAEGDLRLDERPPLDALRELISFTFDYHIANPDRVRLVMVENIHKGRHLSAMPFLKELNATVIAAMKRICERGQASGVIRKDADPLEIYLSIAAVSFFNVSNRYTVSAIFKYDMASKEAYAARKQHATDMILRYVAA
jgi:AcrR family transcriptional regulator